MDRRTLLFVVIVSLAFVGVNFYFSRQTAESNQREIELRKARQERVMEQAKQEVAQKTAPLSSLPLVPLYQDEGESLVAGYAIQESESLLTIAWTRPMPTTLFAKGEEWTLKTPHATRQAPTLYVKRGFSELTIANVPDQGVFDLQLVTLGEEPTVHYGKYIDGTLSLPLDSLDESAVALYKAPEGYLPLGYYEPNGKVLVELQTLPVLSPFAKISPSSLPTPTESDEQYYVLENESVQIVFSNVGGAAAEINLPFRSRENRVSVVKEIGFDRELAKDSPRNARFPQHPYKVPNNPELQAPGPVGGFYPLIRRDQMRAAKGKAAKIPPEYYAFNIVSEYPEQAKLVYRLKEFAPGKIVFEGVQPHRKITKTFTLKEGEGSAPYLLDLDVQIEGDARGLWLTSGVPEVEIMSNRYNPLVQYRVYRKGKGEVEKLDLPKPKEVVSISSVHPEWVVNSNGYMGVILDPISEVSPGYRTRGIPGQLVPTRLSLLDPEYEPYPASKYPGYETLLPLPTKGGSTKLRFYTGPFEEKTLKLVDRTLLKTSGENPHYLSSRTFHGWFSFISAPFSKFLYIVMKFFHSITGSWGFAIILLTVFLKVLLYPLNAWSIKSMRRMQKISPKVQAIQAKHKKDPKKAQMEIMQLYRKEKVNPFTGCIPILIQIPFLIGMFDLLKSSFQLRGAVFIPGWIDNLTAPDVLFSWDKPIFFFGTSFHLLPFLLGGVMFLQQRISAKLPKDKSQWTDQQRQQRGMGTIMTVVFTVMFYNFPSGLNLYWLSSMSIGILQQWLTNRILDKKGNGSSKPTLVKSS